jgi:hypothetical protein
MAKTPQLNIRLTKEQDDVIAAAVFVRELRSPQTLLEPLLEKLTNDLLSDPEISQAVRLRSDRRRSDVVRPLDERRGARTGEVRSG